MDNSKKTVHSSGPLGMLVRSGQIKSIEADNEDQFGKTRFRHDYRNDLAPYFKTATGIVFSENELFNVDPKQCEPWKYANRLDGDMGNIQELVRSIKDNGQLQPGLIRPHPKPYNNIKYEVIFGRRRYEACLQLNLPFLVIKKNIVNIEEALLYQEVENRERKDISNYSNAMLYKKLLDNGVFKNEKDLSDKLKISLSKIYDLMAYAKIPSEIVKLISDIHGLSNNLALKIVSILKNSPQMRLNLLKIAPEIGVTITSPVKLEASLVEKNNKDNYVIKAIKYKSSLGAKLFTFKINHKGLPCIVVDKNIRNINYEELCKYLATYLERMIQTNKN